MMHEATFDGVALAAGNTASTDFERTLQWESLLHLTYAVWRVADAAVENDLLRHRIKQVATDILASYPNALRDKEVAGSMLASARAIRALLSLAQKLTRSSEVNFMILKEEYQKLETAFLSSSLERKQAPRAVEAERGQPVAPAQEQPREKKQRTILPEMQGSLTDRQQKILQFFQKRGGEHIKLREVTQLFSGLTDRTIRSDLKELCTKNFLVRSEGHGQASFYKLTR